MIQLKTVNKKRDPIYSMGKLIRRRNELYDLVHNWPGLRDYWLGHTDSIFGRYQSLSDLDRMEAEAAEEETDDYKDATSLTEQEELDALDANNKADQATEDDSQHAVIRIPATSEDRASSKRTHNTSLPFIDIKVR